MAAARAVSRAGSRLLQAGRPVRGGRGSEMSIGRPQMPQDALNDGILSDQRHQVHTPAAGGTRENIAAS